MIKTTGLLVSMACLGIVMVGGGASVQPVDSEQPTPSERTVGPATEAEPRTKEGKTKTAAEIKKSIPKKYFDVHGRVWYQLVNITIPPLSELRKLDIDQPPQLFVVIKRDGKKIKSTTAGTGWTVDLPTERTNQVPIGIGVPARYTLEVWDDDVFFDEHILNITQLKGEAFESLVIYEKGDTFTSKADLLKLTWKRILPPKEYRAKKTSK